MWNSMLFFVQSITGINASATTKVSSGTINALIIVQVACSKMWIDPLGD